MADAHEHSNLLLQPIDLGLLARTRTLLKLLDRMPHARALLNTQVYGSKVTLPKLLLQRVLLVEAVGGALERVSEDEACLCKDTEFVAILQFTSLVPPNDRIVDERAVPR